MGGLLRAEWMRIRRRKDLWIAPFALVAFSIASYLSALSTATSAGLVPQGEGLPPDIARQVADQIHQRLMQFSLPASVLQVTTGAEILFLSLMAYLASAITGGEFANGTIRTSLLACPNRTKFLAARTAALAAVAALLVAAITACALILPSLAGVTGTELPVESSLGSAAAGAILTSVLLAGFFIAALSTLIVLIVRNSAVAMVLTLGYVLAEGAVVALLTRLPGETPLQYILPMHDVGALIRQLSGDTAQSVAPALLVFMLITWVIVILAISVRVLLTCDIIE